MNSSRYLGMAIIGAVLASLLAISLACAAKEPTPTSVPPAPTARPAAPAPIVTPTVAVAPATPRPTLSPTPISSISPQYGGTVRYALEMALNTLDPFHSTDFRENTAFFILYNGLTRYTSDFTILPDLAKSWEVSSDGKAVSFNLEKGVKFTDGTDFNARAVQWNFEKATAPDFGAIVQPVLSDAVARSDIVDDYTITIRLTKPFRPFIAITGSERFRVISPTAWEKQGKQGFSEKPVGTGPFKLKEWIPRNRMIFVRNESYWNRGKPYLDTIELQDVTDQSVQLAMLRTGETDLVTEVKGTALPLLQDNPRVNISRLKSGVWRGFSMHVNKAPWNNKALRQAIGYSIDRQKFVDVQLGGEGRPAYYPRDGAVWWGTDEKIYDYNVQKAKEKLAEAGYPSGVSFKYQCQNIDSEMRACEILQAMMQAAGINATIEPIVATEFWSQARTGKLPFVNFWVNVRADPHLDLEWIFHSNGSLAKGYSLHSLPEVDKLIDQAVGIYDKTKARELYLQAQKIYMEEAIQIPIWRFHTIAAVGKRVQNWEWIQDGLPRLGDLWIQK